jgi:glycosyltransferase involved in cell wall biosynthesis
VAFSVVVPAHNEERFLPRSLAAIERAAQRADAEVEVVVVANRCTDRTVEIARDAGAMVVERGDRNIAAVRNAGVAASTGDVVVTVDADCVMSSGALLEVGRLLGTGRHVGGGTKVRAERWSAGIVATYILMEAVTRAARLGGGMFWCARADFDAIGGFDETALVAEDIAFARRLKSHGRAAGRRFTVMRAEWITASCRKFDAFGDWHMFAMGRELPAIRRAADGTDTAWVDRYFFDFGD